MSGRRINSVNFVAFTYPAGSRLGATVRYLRKCSGLSLAQLATEAEIHASDIARIESGDATPELSEVNAILVVLGYELAVRQQYNSRPTEWASCADDKADQCQRCS